MTIRIVIADDHRIMRDGLVALLRGQPDFEVVGEAPDGAELARLTRKLKPDIAVTDLSMAGLNGLEAIRRIRADEPGVKLLCLSVHAESRLVLAVLDAGASGYVLKECSFEELVQAIRQVVAGQVYLSAQLVGVVVQEYRARVTGGAPQDSASVLTPRERELVQLFSEGYSTNAIAERLYVSAKTVATHRQHILQKLRIGSMAELTRYALREGLSSLDSGGASALPAA
ncbi:response regulator transcription factor [Ramlibacter sp. WS9]|uniref:response regulator n=1 Tax=Ramlibacter sp. WS9 TaxID=1882741 RepID=UPI001144915C|nr:response regulator transcription factor [Ramlibacter sp. WS9]ROZ72662.1 DNA-binding response regulator [Ramlibacter sp. WS9]